MKINGNEVSKELLAKAMSCETPEELEKLAKEAGVELSEEQAKAFLAELDEIDLDLEQMRQAAGGGCWNDCPQWLDCPDHKHRCTFYHPM